MFSINKIVAEAFIDEVIELYRTMYGHHDEHTHLLIFHAKSSLEIIANSDAPYHDINHTILVTMAGQEILRGKHLLEGSVTAENWLNFIISLLYHDIGYVRGICSEDRGGTYVINDKMGKVSPPDDSTDAYLTPYHVDRGKIYLSEHLENDKRLDLQSILDNIERTRFPVPDDSAYQETTDYPGLARAADLIGQLADPQYMKKVNSLFAELSETGQTGTLGYSSPTDIKKGYSKFFWEKVDPFIGEGLRYLRCTKVGQQWMANLYANLFSEITETPAFGPERRTLPDRRSVSTGKAINHNDRKSSGRRRSDSLLREVPPLRKLSG